MDALAALWQEVTGEPLPPVTFTGDEHVLPGRYRVAHAAAVCVAATTLAADAGSKVHIGHAAEAFRSERHLRPPADLWTPLSGDYRTADGWVRLHANYPHHAAAILRALGVPEDGVRAEAARRRAVDVEESVLAEGGAAAAMRTREEWLTDGPGAAIRTEPLVAIERIDETGQRDSVVGAQRPANGPGPAALAGVRVLDLTHVIAGPVGGRALAAHGADVLHVGAAHLPVLEQLVLDTGFGKRSCHLDLRAEPDRLRALVSGADVFLQSYRPGALAAKGFGARDLAAMRPGIVVVELAAYGHTGPWRDRRGFDSLVQMSCGIAAGDPPAPLPVQALDHATGWLAAFGTIAALRRRATEGGSWRVRLSLARTAEWLHDLGRRDDVPVREVDVRPFLDETDSDFGRLTHLRVPGARIRPAGPRRPGRDPAEWW
ncbi:CoA transferase [Actinophytocola gossypii]|uniref:CoA transferase n=1 Tax=Actinophytocola gossypii TaxID=2812003 RepID=UPI0021A57DF9|nr:CoA transferase [Actinophytocola gossypii]